VLATTDTTHDCFDLIDRPEEWLQGDGDLGQRIERIAQRGLERGDFVIAIGADTPGLPGRLLEQARVGLERADAVLGPCADGGFYLVGLTRCPPGLLQDLPWGEVTTFVSTRTRLIERGLAVEIIEPWFDVDRPQDLGRLRLAIDRGEIHAPETARALAMLSSGVSRSRVSVIVPVLNEESRIEGLMDALSAIEGVDEVIVVDGGSTDRTADLVRARPWVGLRRARRGRGAQMNAGAKIATGDVLLFLHADVRLPRDAVRWVDEALVEPDVVGGAFRTWTVADGARTWLAPFLHLADLRSRYTSLPYGDQGIFVRAAVFRQLGGFPEQALLEDLEFSRRLRELGPIRTVPAAVRVSGRRFLARPVYYALVVNVFPLLYRLGVPPRVVERLYGNPR
jgi:rSAM/selenodomain-associated transferase 2